MLDIAQLRRDLPGVINRLERRQKPQAFLDDERFSALEAERKLLQVRTEELQARRNALSKQIGQLKGKAGDASAEMAEVNRIADEQKNGAARLEAIQSELSLMLMSVPNLPQDDVPVGVDEKANVEVRRWGTPRDFDFAAKDHVDLGAALGLDFETGARLSGSRFTFLRGPAARLHRALAQFMLDMQTREHGYTECYTPYIVNREILEGTGQLPKFKHDMFWVSRGGDEEQAEQYLISTSEISLTNSVRAQILKAEDLPIKLTAHSPCACCRPWNCRTAWSCSAAATSVLAPPRPTTLRSGCLGRTPTARSAAVPTARPFRRAGCKRAFATRKARPNSCTRSTAQGSRWAAHWSR
jgi:seryl-tRNA synthetase